MICVFKSCYGGSRPIVTYTTEEPKWNTEELQIYRTGMAVIHPTS